jgi:hypothetical protein
MRLQPLGYGFGRAAYFFNKLLGPKPKEMQRAESLLTAL